MDHDSDQPPVLVTNCVGLTIRGLSVTNSTFAGAALLVVDCQNTLIDGLALGGEIAQLASGVTFTGTRGEVLSGLVIRNVMAPHVQTAGILLSAGEKGGTLENFIISGNVARVKNTFTGDRGIIEDNLE